MKNFRDELRLITNHTEWTNDEKFEAIDELHERYVAKTVKLFTIPDVRQRFREFNEGDIVNYQWLNDKPLRYRITKVWNDGFGFFDLKIIDEDKNYDGHFYEEYLSVTYRDLLDANVA